MLSELSNLVTACSVLSEFFPAIPESELMALSREEMRELARLAAQELGYCEAGPDLPGLFCCSRCQP